MQEALAAAGYSLVDWDDRADVRVVNTCTVTSKSDRTCRHEIHAAKRLDPGCVLVATGCFAQVAPDVLAELPGVDLVLGNPDKEDLAAHLGRALRDREAGDGLAPAAAPGAAPACRPAVTVSPYPEQPRFETASFAHFHGRTRAFLKVQTGCDSHCSYCIVPLARGSARSMAESDALREVRRLAAGGYREIVLTGVDLGSWGKDTGEGSLAGLLDLLLREVGDLGRLRLSSVEPLEVNDRLLDVVERAGDRMARHFHLPLQSGSDTILKAMNRPYSAAQYLAATQRIARRLPDAALGADVIVGFPGETELEFTETMALVGASPLTYLHVFGYSDRPGTPAAALPPKAKVKAEVIKDRSERLRILGKTKGEAFRDTLKGSVQRALMLEEQGGDGRLVGLTGDYQEVLVYGDKQLMNRFVRVQLADVLPSGRWEATLLEVEP